MQVLSNVTVPLRPGGENLQRIQYCLSHRPLFPRRTVQELRLGPHPIDASRIYIPVLVHGWRNTNSSAVVPPLWIRKFFGTQSDTGDELSEEGTCLSGQFLGSFLPRLSNQPS